ncbi:MAG: hypothetical protein M3083_18290 [Actinomycetota bacterium]|nr:hypothetical protein [Actinomycetota bacterium]
MALHIASILVGVVEHNRRPFPRSFSVPQRLLSKTDTTGSFWAQKGT